NGIRFRNLERTASDTNMVTEVWDDNQAASLCTNRFCPGFTGAVVLDKWFPQRAGIGPAYVDVTTNANLFVSRPTVAYFQQPGQTLAAITHCLLNGDLTVSHDVVPASIVSIGTNTQGVEETVSSYQSLYDVTPNEAVEFGVTIDVSTVNSTIDIPSLQ